MNWKTVASSCVTVFSNFLEFRWAFCIKIYKKIKKNYEVCLYISLVGGAMIGDVCKREFIHAR